MAEYTPNSHKFKTEQKDSAAERKKLDKVVSGSVKAKKKSEIRKFADVFISEDASNVKSYILADVLIPAIKKLISDIVTDGIDMVLYGGTNRNKNSSGSRASYISYNSYSTRRDDRRPSNDPRTITSYNYNEITVPTRGEAEAVLSRMNEQLESYGTVSIADLYDLVGIIGNYTDCKYGWTDLRTADAVRVRDGYLLKLPKVVPLH